MVCSRAVSATRLSGSRSERVRVRVRRWRLRSCAIIGGVAASLAMTACGSGTRQDAHEPSGKFKVSIASATFPTAQKISQRTHLVISVRNAGAKTIPNLAVTICNVTCTYPAPPGEGTSAQAFAADVNEQYLANPSRPVWIVDQAPGSCGYICRSGSPGGAVTAYSNTWALGSLKPGATARFDWKVTAVAPGHHIVAWQIAAGLNAKAKAILANGSPAQGSFPVTISSAPTQSFVNSNGQVVTTP
jgi:hypothetical protein